MQVTISRNNLCYGSVPSYSATFPMPFISSATCTPSARNARIIEASVMLLPLSKRQTCALCTPIFSPSSA